MGCGQVRNYHLVFLNNHGQCIVDKFTKLSKMWFSLEFFTAHSSQFSSTTVDI